ncbi:MAG: hypothetical protein HON53_03610 [Planctomycetaceae bacterium]|jgi:hypothetical protein|nr:hypothetical protein [Planctomycetaceae bacterium]MBT6153412.1 hypothetical protein [Planctomycetaceae bacterium]MBT6485764.1 hypothetical protein [Planctomycetaceae bacterium]MBT6494359.1 hypothetical protein [Planctomycetaceae bacterium]
MNVRDCGSSRFSVFDRFGVSASIRFGKGCKEVGRRVPPVRRTLIFQDVLEQQEVTKRRKNGVPDQSDQNDSLPAVCPYSIVKYSVVLPYVLSYGDSFIEYSRWCSEPRDMERNVAAESHHDDSPTWTRLASEAAKCEIAHAGGGFLVFVLKADR